MVIRGSSGYLVPMESSPETLKPPIAIACTAIGIITVCLFALGIIISWLPVGGNLLRLAFCVVTYPALVAWQQYVSVFRFNKRAASVTAFLGGLAGVPTTLLLFFTLVHEGMKGIDWEGCTTASVISVTGLACVVCNGIWLQHVKAAEEQGTAPKPREKFSLGELMWFVVAVSFVMAVSSYWQRTFSGPPL